MRVDRDFLMRIRRRIGVVLGETVECALLALGLMSALVLIINGFDGVATARFIDNAVDRLLAAGPARQAAFFRFSLSCFLVGFAGVLVIRAIDRATKGRKKA